MNANFITAIILTLIAICTINIYGQTNWTKYINNPVLTKGPDNYDIIAIGQPTTLYENDTIKMWYGGVGSDMKARICYAFSTDGINWTKHSNHVIDVGSQGEWDSGWLDTPEIVKDNTGYKMYYYGDTIQQFAAINSAIGMATSIDGINWTKHPNNPIFTKGNLGEWDGSWVESPAVIFDSITGEYKMWYNGIDTTTWKIQIGLATSTNGINWTKYDNNPVIQTSYWGGYDDIWLGTPTVLKIENYYEMWYSATSTNSYNYIKKSFDTISVCYATSTDGINWNKHSNNPLFNTFTAPYDSLVDRGGPWAPSVIYNQNTNNYMMWFEAHGGNENYSISLVTALKTTTSIDIQNLKTPSLSIFPNPVNSTAIIKSTETLEAATLRIFNAIGQTVYLIENINNNEISINRDNIDSGMYIIQLTNKGNIITSKFIVE